MLGQRVAPRGWPAVPWRALSLALITLLVMGRGAYYARQRTQTVAAPIYQTATVAAAPSPSRRASSICWSASCVILVRYSRAKQSSTVSGATIK